MILYSAHSLISNNNDIERMELMCPRVKVARSISPSHYFPISQNYLNTDCLLNTTFTIPKFHSSWAILYECDPMDLKGIAYMVTKIEMTELANLDY